MGLSDYLLQRKRQRILNEYLRDLPWEFSLADYLIMFVGLHLVGRNEMLWAWKVVPWKVWHTDRG